MSSAEYLYVVFKEAERPLWYMRWLKFGFSHCFVIEPYKGRWKKYEYGHGAMRLDIIDDFDITKEECIIVKCVKRPIKQKLMLMTCVGFVKMLIGSDSRAITPYQLFRSLK